MPSKYRGRTYYHTKRRVAAATTLQRAFRRRRPVRKRGRARPMRALSIGYKGPPNQYRFIRETRPVTIDIGDATSTGVTLIAGTGAIPNTSVYEFGNFSVDQLPGFPEMAALFAQYKVDKIETVLIPQWTQNVQAAITPLTGGWAGTGAVPNLVLTRINVKYLTNGYTLPTTAEANRDKLAQVMKKTRSLYGSKKWLKVNTWKPKVDMEIDDGVGGVNAVQTAQPWLPCATAADQRFQMNDLIFADRLDGTDFAVGIYRYRMYHRVHFRCGFVG